MKRFFFSIIIGSFIVLPVAGHAQAKEDVFTVPKVRSWFDTTYEKTEQFRLKQSVYFTKMRDEAKKELNIEQSSVITPDAESSEIDEIITEYKEDIQLPGILTYVKYIAGIALSTLFSSALLFYIAALLLGLIVVRFLVGRAV